MEAIRLVKSDVVVEKAPDDVCEDCQRSPAKFVVAIDFRNTGLRAPIGGRLCRDCARTLARRLRDGLPS